MHSTTQVVLLFDPGSSDWVFKYSQCSLLRGLSHGGERVAELNIWCSKVKGSKWNYTSEGSYLMTDSISQVCFQSICE